MKSKYDINDFVNLLTEQKVVEDITRNVKERRRELNLTQQGLAKRSGVSYGSIRRFETTGEISFASLLKIANVLGCLGEFDELFSKENITDLRDY